MSDTRDAHSTLQRAHQLCGKLADRIDSAQGSMGQRAKIKSKRDTLKFCVNTAIRLAQMLQSEFSAADAAWVEAIEDRVRKLMGRGKR